MQLGGRTVVHLAAHLVAKTAGTLGCQKVDSSVARMEWKKVAMTADNLADCLDEQRAGSSVVQLVDTKVELSVATSAGM